MITNKKKQAKKSNDTISCGSGFLSEVFFSFATYQRSIGFTKVRMESINLQVTHTSIFHFTTDHNLPSFTGPCRASTLKNLQFMGKYTAAWTQLNAEQALGLKIVPAHFNFWYWAQICLKLNFPTSCICWLGGGVKCFSNFWCWVQIWLKPKFYISSVGEGVFFQLLMFNQNLPETQFPYVWSGEGVFPCNFDAKSKSS